MNSQEYLPTAGSSIAATYNCTPLQSHGYNTRESAAAALPVRRRRQSAERVGGRGSAVHVAARDQQADPPARGRARVARLRAPGQAPHEPYAGRRSRGRDGAARIARNRQPQARRRRISRSEEHTSELQSHVNLVCRLLLEKKKT